MHLSFVASYVKIRGKNKIKPTQTKTKKPFPEEGEME